MELPPSQINPDSSTAKLDLMQLDKDRAAIAIVDMERTNWEEAVTFVTNKVGFRMRELIRIFRKNYWGVFDNPVDSNTGREKVWMPLAASTVETWVKNIDMDTKDINFIARNPSGYEITELTRLGVKEYLDRIYFGDTLDEDERQLLIDGTLVWKTWEDNSTGKPIMKRKTIDLLNVYIDPTENNIQDAYRFTERGVTLPSQIALMTGWRNTQSDEGGELPGSQILNKIDGNRRSNFGTRTTGDYRDIWECWGKIPKWLVTGDKQAIDANNEIDGHLVVSGLETAKPKCHLIEENKKKDKFGSCLKPYEEARVSKISGRWYGIGPVERALALQEWLNITANIRINRHYISQLGLFKIKKGKGITPSMLTRLSANGAIQLQDPDDIQPLEMPQEDGSTYKDEETIKYWTQQVTSALPISNGDIMPSSASATANSIASQSAKTAYTLFKEGMGLFIQRWMDRHALPIIAKSVNTGDIVRLSADDGRFQDLVKTIAINNIANELDNNPVVPSNAEMLAELARETQRLLSRPHLFVEVLQELIADAVDTKVHITNEDLDTSVTVQNLMTMMQIAPEYRDEMIREVYDLLGLDQPKLNPQPPAQQPGQPGAGGPQPQAQQPGVPVGGMIPTMQSTMQGANIRAR